MKALFAIALFAAAAGPAFAQASDQQGPDNAAVKGIHDNNSSAPVAGANSFTRKEAIKQIEAKGYKHVAHLKKDTSGVWHGTAVKDGQSGPVSADYQGTVN